jgi:hypothetical protein
MSKDELAGKFLVAGRRRRKEEPECNGCSEGGRPLMGRKGLGKLAGFGVAKRVEVTSKREAEETATRIILDFDDLTAQSTGTEVPVPVETVDPEEGFTKGTKITLSRLLYEPLKSRQDTITKALSEHFGLVCGPGREFDIKLNGESIPPPSMDYAFAWPDPDNTPIEDLVGETVEIEKGRTVSFQYRIRFTKEGNALKASQRGVKIYAHKRLACAPSLLSADTNMHGFRMTDYLDGVVEADFIDDDSALDYIATDRQSIRWESPYLSPLRDFLSGKIKEACAKYQKKRDDTAPGEVKKHKFTQDLIDGLDLSKREQRMAERLAVVLKSGCKQGLEDPDYKEKLPPMLRSIGRGNVLSAITELAKAENPDLHSVANEVAKLTHEEFDEFVAFAKGRLKGITALENVVKGADFNKPENEGVIQKMFEASPWLLDPVFSQFVSADRQHSEVFKNLAKHLEIGQYSNPKQVKLDERPDLVFFIGSETLRVLTIVELKSSNIPLESKHLEQLEGYMADAEEWLDQNDIGSFQVTGQLIGTLGKPDSKARGVKALRRRLKKRGVNEDWMVRSLLKVLDDTKNAHAELIALQAVTETA